MAPSALAGTRMRERAAVGCEQRARRERRRPCGRPRRTRPRRRAAGGARPCRSRLSLQPRDERWPALSGRNETETGLQRAQRRERERARERGRARERERQNDKRRHSQTSAIEIDAGSMRATWGNLSSVCPSACLFLSYLLLVLQQLLAMGDVLVPPEITAEVTQIFSPRPRRQCNPHQASPPLRINPLLPLNACVPTAQRRQSTTASSRPRSCICSRLRSLPPPPTPNS